MHMGVRGMSKGIVEGFRAEREELNEIVMKYADLSIKRFYSLDSQAYREGALPRKTKELLGLVASLVLRCDDCIRYHIIRCDEEGVPSEELVEALGIGLVVGEMRDAELLDRDVGRDLAHGHVVLVGEGHLAVAIDAARGDQGQVALGEWRDGPYQRRGCFVVGPAVFRVAEAVVRVPGLADVVDGVEIGSSHVREPTEAPV